MPSTPKLIFDTTVLSTFASTDRLVLLRARYAECGYTTVEVVTELSQGVRAGYSYLEQAVAQVRPLSPNGWLTVLCPVSAEEFVIRSELDVALGPGEASCLSLAKTRSLTIATDDLATRRAAGRLGVTVTGTLGILIASARDGSLTLAGANGTLAAMIRLRYRSPFDKLDDLI
ncbi:MAG: hypothetical protein ACYC5O_20425 [Anaerolineae bacterium]